MYQSWSHKHRAVHCRHIYIASYSLSCSHIWHHEKPSTKSPVVEPVDGPHHFMGKLSTAHFITTYLCCLCEANLLPHTWAAYVKWAYCPMPALPMWGEGKRLTLFEQANIEKLHRYGHFVLLWGKYCEIVFWFSNCAHCHLYNRSVVVKKTQVINAVLLGQLMM